MIYAKAGERLEWNETICCSLSLFGQEPEDSAEEPAAELETEVDQEPEEEPQCLDY